MGLGEDAVVYQWNKEGLFQNSKLYMYQFLLPYKMLRDWLV